jgi:hypothetical protein
VKTRICDIAKRHETHEASSCHAWSSTSHTAPAASSGALHPRTGQVRPDISSACGPNSLRNTEIGTRPRYKSSRCSWHGQDSAHATKRSTTPPAKRTIVIYAENHGSFTSWPIASTQNPSPEFAEFSSSASPATERTCKSDTPGKRCQACEGYWLGIAPEEWVYAPRLYLWIGASGHKQVVNVLSAAWRKNIANSENQRGVRTRRLAVTLGGPDVMDVPAFRKIRQTRQLQTCEAPAAIQNKKECNASPQISGALTTSRPQQHGRAYHLQSRHLCPRHLHDCPCEKQHARKHAGDRMCVCVNACRGIRNEGIACHNLPLVYRFHLQTPTAYSGAHTHTHRRTNT